MAIIAPNPGGFDRAVKENENVRTGDALPHGWDIRMLLEHLARIETMGLQALHEGRLACRTHSDYGDKRAVIRVHEWIIATRLKAVGMRPTYA